MSYIIHIDLRSAFSKNYPYKDWYYAGRRDSTPDDLPSQFKNTPMVTTEKHEAAKINTREEVDKIIKDELIEGTVTIIEV